MPFRLAGLLVAAACICWTPLGAARAAVLIEAEKAGQALRLVVDRAEQRVLVTAPGLRALVDLGAGLVYLLPPDGPAGRVHARYRPGYTEPPPYRVERFGPGPMIAGNGSTYFVLFDEDRVCAEAMLSGWMSPFLDPAVRALALLEQLSPPAAGDTCAAIPFPTYAAAGWPLMAGKADRPAFVTTRIAFDYRPAADELVAPASSRALAVGEPGARVGLPPS